MGGKKKSAKVQVKKDSKYKIPTAFDCPMCDAKAAIEIKQHKSESTATVRCRACNQPNPAFTVSMGRLDKPIDAFFEFYEWLRAQDAQHLQRNHIDVHATAATRRDVVVEAAAAGPATGMGGRARTDNSVLPDDQSGDEDDEEVAGIMANE